MQRREFMRRAASGTAALTALTTWELLHEYEARGLPTSGGMGIEEGMYLMERGKERNTVPVIRPEIEENPRAVFLIETHVDAKADETGHFSDAWPQLEAEGTSVASRIFVKGDQRGGCTFIKPNFTMVYPHCYNRTTGVYSSPDFIVGMARHLRSIGNTNIITGQTASPAINHRQGRIYDAFDPAELPLIEAGYERWEHYEEHELNWFKTKNSIVTEELPYFRPIGDPDCTLINVATLKCHMNGLTTLTVKNLQGCVPRGWGQFCTPWDQIESESERMGTDYGNYRKDWQQAIEASFLKHRAASFKYWDYFGAYKTYEERGGWDAWRKAKKDGPGAIAAFTRGIDQLMQRELWLQRGLDNAEVIRPHLNIIEGIIGLDGDELHRNNIGHDQLVNMVVAGKSPFEVDAIGSYIMGHDPRELWYTRVAKERGLGECDPSKIDIYQIRDNGKIEKINLAQVRRHPLGLNWDRQKNPDQRLFW